MRVIKIYVDGSYNPSEKIGAFAFVIVQGDEILLEYSKSFNKREYPSMTINKMELQAVISSINHIRSNGYKPKHFNFYIFTDSQYVQLGYNKWLERRKNNSNNKGLWTALDESINMFKEISNMFIQWIPSNSEDRYHQRAHELCQISMKSYLLNKIEIE